MSDDYVPPRVWEYDPNFGGVMAKTNRPTSGAVKETTLEVGRHPLQLYSYGGPNGQKVTILLEELLAAGRDDAEYDAWLIDMSKGDQFGSGLVEINPNAKVPALVDRSEDNPVPIFESGAILVYLAEKFGMFLPEDPAARIETLAWLFWQVGSAPFVGGGFGHFYTYAPIKVEYAINRYTMETKRQFDLLDKRLASREFIMGDQYTLADIAMWPWYGAVASGSMYNAAEFLDAQSYPHLLRWTASIAERPAVKRGHRVNRPDLGDAGLLERHDQSDFAKFGL
jgi:GST-like protein